MTDKAVGYVLLTEEMIADARGYMDRVYQSLAAEDASRDERYRGVYERGYHAGANAAFSALLAFVDKGGRVGLPMGRDSLHVIGASGGSYDGRTGGVAVSAFLDAVHAHHLQLGIRSGNCEACSARQPLSWHDDARAGRLRTAIVGGHPIDQPDSPSSAGRTPSPRAASDARRGADLAPRSAA